MQLALRADSDPGIWSAPTPPARRDKKLLMAGVALVGASATELARRPPLLTYFTMRILKYMPKNTMRILKHMLNKTHHVHAHGEFR